MTGQGPGGGRCGIGSRGGQPSPKGSAVTSLTQVIFENNMFMALISFAGLPSNPMELMVWMAPTMPREGHSKRCSTRGPPYDRPPKGAVRCLKRVGGGAV